MGTWIHVHLLFVAVLTILSSSIRHSCFGDQCFKVSRGNDNRTDDMSLQYEDEYAYYYGDSDPHYDDDDRFSDDYVAYPDDGYVNSLEEHSIDLSENYSALLNDVGQKGDQSSQDSQINSTTEETVSDQSHSVASEVYQNSSVGAPLSELADIEVVNREDEVPVDVAQSKLDETLERPKTISDYKIDTGVESENGILGEAIEFTTEISSSTVLNEASGGDDRPVIFVLTRHHITLFYLYMSSLILLFVAILLALCCLNRVRGGKFLRTSSHLSASPLRSLDSQTDVEKSRCANALSCCYDINNVDEDNKVGSRAPSSRLVENREPGMPLLYADADRAASARRLAQELTMRQQVSRPASPYTASPSSSLLLPTASPAHSEMNHDSNNNNNNNNNNSGGRQYRFGSLLKNQSFRAACCSDDVKSNDVRDVDWKFRLTSSPTVNVANEFRAEMVSRNADKSSASSTAAADIEDKKLNNCGFEPPTSIHSSAFLVKSRCGAPQRPSSSVVASDSQTQLSSNVSNTASLRRQTSSAASRRIVSGHHRQMGNVEIAR